jgi:hypothetical protein
MATVTVRRGPFAFVDRTLDSLSPRDRRLLVGLVLVFVALMTFGYWWLLSGLQEDRASRVRSAKEVYAAISEDAKRLEVANRQFQSQEGRLREAASRPVTAWVEELAKTHTLDQQLAKVTQTGAEAIGDLTQTKYTIELKKAPQELVYRFLYDLESSDFPASVDSAKFKVSLVKSDKMLDATFDIVVLSVGEG